MQHMVDKQVSEMRVFEKGDKAENKFWFFLLPTHATMHTNAL